MAKKATVTNLAKGMINPDYNNRKPRRSRRSR